MLKSKLQSRASVQRKRHFRRLPFANKGAKRIPKIDVIATACPLENGMLDPANFLPSLLRSCIFRKVLAIFFFLSATLRRDFFLGFVTPCFPFPSLCHTLHILALFCRLVPVLQSLTRSRFVPFIAIVHSRA